MKKSRFKVYLICAIIFAVIGAVGGALINYFLSDPQPTLMEAFMKFDYVGLGAGIGAVLGLVAAYMFRPKTNTTNIKAKTKGQTASGVEMDLASDAKWMDPKGVEQEAANPQAKMIYTTWAQLPSVKKTGLVFMNSMIDGKYRIGMKDEYHGLIIGTTASGKTSACLVPTIRILGHSGEKPHMVITDPKGELYTSTSRILEDEGYRVITLNLRDAFASSRWNPMGHVYDIYHKGKNCRNSIKRCSDGHNPKDLGFKTLPGANYGQVWYGFEGIAYADEDSLRVAVNSAEQVYIDQAQSELREICNTISPKSKNATDPTWEEGAQDFLYGCALAMLEDSMDPELGMTKEKFNFYNLYKIATYRDPDAEAPFETLRDYLLKGRDAATSTVPNMTSTVINNAPGTTKSYLGVLAGKISFMNDLGIAYLTSESDLDFDDFTSKPTVFYLIIPDDREERHNLALLCISQLYKRLVDKANSYPESKLPTHVYFILEEFGNMPPIPKFDSMITVARGRNILFEMACQSYAQLETKYGADGRKTIMQNCNTQIYLGTDDQETRDSFSKMCGDVQLIYEEQNTSESKNTGGKADDGSKQKSTSNQIQRTTRPLITPYELGQIERNTVVVKMFRFNPIKIEQCPSYQTPFFYKKDVEPQVGMMRSLDQQKVYYDIKMRNQKKIKKASSPFDF